MGDQEQLPSIFQAPHNWKGNEELALLQACEHYGFGNWEDISKKMGTRTAEECMHHYSNMYIFGKIGKATWEGKEPNAIVDKTTGFEVPFYPSSQLSESTLHEFQQEMGFMPYRNDFETENDNDAESLICNLSTSSAEDDDLDTSIKLFQVDVYCRKLQERTRRKHIIQEYNLVSQYLEHKLKPAAAKKKSKEDRDFASIKSFCQFLPCAEYEQLLDSLRREKELKLRIKELVRYRRNGVTRQEDCSEFDTVRLKRERRRENNVVNNNSKKKPGPSGARRTGGKKHSEDKMSDSSSQDERGEEEDSKSFDLSSLPGYCLLSEMEKKLCTAIRLKPAHYITFKTVLIRDHLDRQRGLTVKAKFPAGLDKAHRRRIINFLVSNGWISGS